MASDGERLKALLGHGSPAPLPPPQLWRKLLLWGVAAVAVVLVGVWAWAPGGSGSSVAERAGAPSAAGKSNSGWWNNPGLGTQEAPLPATTATAGATASTQSTVAPADADLFRLDAAGQLILDERTRLGVESLLALTEPEQLQDALETHVKGLPAKAAAAARDLVGRYESYVDAQKRSYPPGRAPLVPEEGLAELAGLQALRDSYFGREAAQRMFGEENAVSRRLLELMREDPLPDSPIEDKAMRAQARYDAERAAQAGAQLPAR